MWSLSCCLEDSGCLVRFSILKLYSRNGIKKVTVLVWFFHFVLCYHGNTTRSFTQNTGHVCSMIYSPLLGFANLSALFSVLSTMQTSWLDVVLRIIIFFKWFVWQQHLAKSNSEGLTKKEVWGIIYCLIFVEYTHIWNMGHFTPLYHEVLMYILIYDPSLFSK